MSDRTETLQEVVQMLREMAKDKTTEARDCSRKGALGRASDLRFAATALRVAADKVRDMAKEPKP